MASTANRTSSESLAVTKKTASGLRGRDHLMRTFPPRSAFERGPVDTPTKNTEKKGKMGPEHYHGGRQAGVILEHDKLTLRIAAKRLGGGKKTDREKGGIE